ncbi:MAG: hypothetical protein M3680_20080, partial [Myxococcota bacterium]|nr:hypothetical protein [Myxococcota bacterium]
MFQARYLRWADVDPATHPFAPDALDAALLAPSVAHEPRDRLTRIREADQVLVRVLGLWATGWMWWTDDGGPVGAAGLGPRDG